MSPFLFLLAGLAAGAVAGWFAARATFASSASELGLLRTRAERLDAEVQARVTAEAGAMHLQTRAHELAREVQERQARADEAERLRADSEAARAAAETTAAEAARQAIALAEERDAARREAADTLQRLGQAERTVATQAAETAAQKQALQDKLDALLAAKEELKTQFEATASQALQRSQEQFMAHAKVAFDAARAGASEDLQARQEGVAQLLAPLHERLGQMGARVDAVEKARGEAYGQLSEQLRALGDAHARLDASTTQLATALRSGSARGRWGELHLRRLLEGSGLLDYADFAEQAGVTTEDGARQRPDVVVRLPGERALAVDSKVPLDDYLNASAADDEAARAGHLRQHAAKVRAHAKALAGREYWKTLAGSPPLVVLFLPSDALLADALRCDPDLLDACHRDHVVVATPSTLFAMLKSIGQLWQQETLTREVGEIQKLGVELYDRIGVLADHFDKVGRNLAGATAAYNDAVGSLEGRLLVTAQRLREKGAASQRAISEPAPIGVEVRPFVKPEMRAPSSPSIER